MRSAIILAAAACLSGCASFSGQPGPVITAKMSDDALASYRIPGVLHNYGLLKGRAQRAYRDEVIAVYTQAIDARYFQFRGNLGGESKATNLGFDSLLVGLVGAAALSANDASDIATITTGVLGLRSSIDKNLYFERTLPALFAAMDAERYKVRSSILQNMALVDHAQYPLAAALVDLQEYQQAGTIVAAISAVNAQAAEARNDAKAELDQRVRFACDSEDAVNLAINPVGDFLSVLFADAEAERSTGRTTALNRLRKTADAMGVGAAGTMSIAQLDKAIDDAMFGGFCTVEEVNALKAKLRQAGVGFTAS